MFTRSVFALALLALWAETALATPPACLLAAVNTQPNPANLAGICGRNAHKVQAQISSACGPNTPEAMKAFSSICGAAGHHVAMHKPKPKTTTHARPHHKPTVTKEHTHKVRPTGHAQPHHNRPHAHPNHNRPHAHPTHKAGHASPTAHVVHHAPASAGGSTGTIHAAVQTPSPTSSSHAKGFDGAAGRVDANAFAALAMAAAGLAIFL